jgi:type IV pilus assembly protein PilM
MSNNSVSIYINDTTIRLMVTRGRRITKLAAVPLDIGLGDIDTKEKESALTERIKGLLKSNKVSAHKIILGLSGLHCLTRPLVLPELPRAMLREAVTREARRVLPVPLEQLYISWQVVSLSEGKLHVFMVATPRQIIDMVMRVFNQVGCKPYLMDIKPLALARLAKQADAVVVDVQTKEFDIVVLNGGIPQPVRTVSFPHETISPADKFAIVRDEVKRTVQFFNANSGEKRILPETTLFVSGELAEEPGLHESWAKDLGLKVALLTSPLKCLKQLDPSHYLVNVGLALKESPKEVGSLLPDFNALPDPYQPKQFSTSRLLAVPAAGIAIVIIVLLFLSAQAASAKISTAQNQIKTNNFLIQKKQADKTAAAAAVTGVQQQIAAAEQAYNIFSGALRSMNKTDEITNADINAIFDNQNEGLIIQSIGYNITQISLTGNALTQQQVIDYVRKLTATGRFKEITISNISLGAADENGNTAGYSLACALKENRN